MVKDIRNGRVAVFEVKQVKVLDMLENACTQALQQIDNRQYSKDFQDDFDEVICYGVAFFKKRCLVQKKDEA